MAKYVICDSTGESIGAATSSQSEAAEYVKTTNEGMLPQDKYHFVSQPGSPTSSESYNFGLLQIGRSVGA